MSSLVNEIQLPLTLSEQLDAMLAGWLDRNACEPGVAARDTTATAIITVADAHYAEVEAFCARRAMSIDRVVARRGGFAVLVVSGPALPVRGFTEITGMYRR